MTTSNLFAFGYHRIVLFLIDLSPKNPNSAKAPLFFATTFLIFYEIIPISILLGKLLPKASEDHQTYILIIIGFGLAYFHQEFYRSRMKIDSCREVFLKLSFRSRTLINLLSCGYVILVVLLSWFFLAIEF